MPILSSDNDLRAILERTTTVAVVGLSANPDRDSHRVARYLQQRGYKIIPVNPGVEEVFGIRAVPDIDSIRDLVDMVDIFRRPEHVAAVVEAAIRVGARSVWMQFGAVDREAADRASRAGLDVVVDRCTMAEHRRLFS